MIDPQSPKSIGHDSAGFPIRLGEIDSDGRFVGYIDEEGLAWESRLERDSAVTVGRFGDDYWRWLKTGAVSPEPHALDYLDEVHPDNVEAVLQRIRDMLSGKDLFLVLRWMGAARKAHLN